MLRASTFVATVVGDATKAPEYEIPVVGGHAGVTILPLLSQAKPAIPASILEDKSKRDALTHRIQFGGDEVVEAKAGGGSATLSMAQAGAEFADKVMRAAFKGETGLISPSYVSLMADESAGKAIQKEIGAELAFFSVRVQLGKNGVEKLLPIGEIDATEKEALQKAVTELGPSIDKGLSFKPASKL